MEVPLVNLQAQLAPIRAEVDAAVRGVFDSCSFIRGPAVKRFEAAAAEYLGVEHAIGCGSGSEALYIALLALGVGPGDEVITVPHTYIATPEAIRRTGAKVVFCDVEPIGFTLDPAMLKTLVTPRTKAILPVHIYGQCALMERIAGAAPNAFVVEDVAQAWGATRNGSKAGSMGALSCFSFFPTKTLGACGDGGMVATNDKAIAQIVRSISLHGEGKERYHNDRSGVNSRLDSVQAAVLEVKLRYVDGWNARRAEIAEYYKERFAGSPVQLSEALPGNSHVRHQCVVLVDNRDELSKHLGSVGIGSGCYYPVPQHLQPCFADLGHKAGDFPETERVCARGVSIPSWPEMTDQQQARVADEVLACRA